MNYFLENEVIMRVNIETFRVYVDHFDETLFVFYLFCDFFVFLVIHNAAALAFPDKFIFIVQNCLNHFVKTKLLCEEDCFKFLLRE